MKEYILPIDDTARDWDEMFIAVIRKQNELIRCKDCKYWQDNNGGYPHADCRWRDNETPDADDFCSGAERKKS